MMLTTRDHSRDVAGLTYVYPVLSRRSGGLSIGINLNPNNACNWRCIYCQVPNLTRGSAPEIDIVQLTSELNRLLDAIESAEFRQQFDMDVSTASIRDIAFSGNGEPTSAKNFESIVHAVGEIMQERLHDKVKLVLITNGSLIDKQVVQAGLQQLDRLGGEVWFKIDRVTETGLKEINKAAISIDRIRQNLLSCTTLCRTWIQSCFFKYRGEEPPTKEIEAYLSFLHQLMANGAKLEGVHLYGIERPSMQAEADELAKIDAEWLQELADKIKITGINTLVKE